MSAVFAGEFDTKKCRNCTKDTKYPCPKCGCCEWCHKNEDGILVCAH